MSLVVFSGFLVGLLFGFVLERGYFCQFSGFLDAVVFRNLKIVKGTIWAVLVAMVGFHLLAQFGVITLSPKPFFWGANIIGGIVFAIGVFLVGGCAGGTTFKIGTGLVSYLLAGLGIALGGFLTAEGFLKNFKDFLQTATKVTVDKASPTLASILDLNPWIVVIILAALFIWLLIKIKNRKEQVSGVEKTGGQEQPSLLAGVFKRRWGPAATGIAIGLIGMLAFVASAASGRNYPLGIVEGYVVIFKSFLTGNFQLINWMYLLIPGIILGSALSSFLAGEFRLRLPKARQIAPMLIGGILIGVGAVTMAGCNVTHILSGIPQLSIGSLVSSFAIFGTIYLIAYQKFIRKKPALYGS